MVGCGWSMIIMGVILYIYWDDIVYELESLVTNQFLKGLQRALNNAQVYDWFLKDFGQKGMEVLSSWKLIMTSYEWFPNSTHLLKYLKSDSIGSISVLQLWILHWNIQCLHSQCITRYDVCLVCVVLILVAYITYLFGACLLARFLVCSITLNEVLVSLDSFDLLP